MAVPLPVSNSAARRLFIARHGLAHAPNARLGRQGLLALIDELGFVQLDSVNTVERAHHMILFARNQTYRREDLTHLLERDRDLFENWTHDAAIIPTRFWPYWLRHFERSAPDLRARWRSWRDAGYEEELDALLDRIRREGPLKCRALSADEPRKTPGWWNWGKAKTAMEWHWRTGALCIHRREGFEKVYDLAERVIPDAHRAQLVSDRALVDWACEGALDRLGFATSGEIAAFWALASPAEARDWTLRESARLIEVEIEGAKGQPPRKAFAWRTIEEAIAAAPEPPPRIRALSPFDPMLRDRKRALRLFGFDYRIEIFTPAEKRRYGYYVFPLMEGDRMIGRIDMRRTDGGAALEITRLWLEPGIRLGAGREDRLCAELERQRRFAGCGTLRFAEGWRGERA